METCTIVTRKTTTIAVAGSVMVLGSPTEAAPVGPAIRALRAWLSSERKDDNEQILERLQQKAGKGVPARPVQPKPAEPDLITLVLGIGVLMFAFWVMHKLHQRKQRQEG